MPFWVYGHDDETGEPARFSSEAANEDAAREEAAAHGMVVKSVKPPYVAKKSAGARVPGAAQAPPSPTCPSKPKPCTRCGCPISELARYCSHCGVAIRSYPHPAGFWIRVAASLVDTLVFIPVIAVVFVALSTKRLPLAILASIPGFIYKPFMECHYGATFGKMACGLRVVDSDGKRLSLASAYVRYLPFLAGGAIGLLTTLWLFSTPEFKHVSGFLETGRLMKENPYDPLKTVVNIAALIDCVVVVFTHRKRALHDMLAGSFCIRGTGYLKH